MKSSMLRFILFCCCFPDSADKCGVGAPAVSLFSSEPLKHVMPRGDFSEVEGALEHLQTFTGTRDTNQAELLSRKALWRLENHRYSDFRITPSWL